MSERLTHGSLFSGIGGPEIAAEIMGWKNVFHCEINPFGRKILDYWFPNSKSYEDITKTDFREWQGKINVLTGGFPCQPFSCAGQRKGAEDDRYLWPEMLRAIREIQPDWVVGENVAGILTMVQPGSETALGREESLFGEVDRERTLHRQEYVVETVCNDLEREGYSVQPVVIPACAVGAPHRRDRVWFIAKRAATDSTDAGTETVQRERKDGVLSDKYVTHTDGKKLQKRLETGRRTKRKIEQGWTMELNDLAACGMLPTPAARDYQPSVSPQALKRKNGKMRTDALCNLPVMLGEHHLQNGGKTSQLNPRFVAEMMGFSPDWTVLPFQSGGKNR